MVDPDPNEDKGIGVAPEDNSDDALGDRSDCVVTGLTESCA